MSTGSSSNCQSAGIQDSETAHVSAAPDSFQTMQSRNMKIWERYVRECGLMYRADYSIPYDPGIEILNDDSSTVQEQKRKKLKTHFYNSSVFLAKFMTGLYRINSDGIEERIQYYPLPDENSSTIIACGYQDIRVYYAPEAGGKFCATGLAGDINSPQAKTDDKYLNRVLIENMRAALVLAHNAKLSGWTSVNFGKTADPSRRLALQIACEIVGLDSSGEKVDLAALPQNTAHGRNIAKFAHDVLSVFEESPHEYYGFAGFNTSAANVTVTQVDLNDGLILDDDVPAAPKVTHPNPPVPV